MLLAAITHAARNPGAIAEEFDVSLPTKSRLLDKLVRQQLVVRAPDDGDQRVRRLVQARLGRAIVAEILGSRPELRLTSSKDSPSTNFAA